MTAVVDKIIQDSARGILIIPVWPKFAWFHLLGKIAVKWLDIPPHTLFFPERSRTEIVSETQVAN